MAERATASPADSPLRRRWPWLIALFGWYVRRFVTQHFRAVRVSRDGELPTLPKGPVIVAMNHPSWWDPMIGILLSQQMARRVHVAPMETQALERYPLFRRLGAFGIEPGSATGLRELRRVADELFRTGGATLWITPQGAFRDARHRPLEIKPGVGVLARQLREGMILPLAVEYPFWTEQRPEVLVRFGRPIVVSDGSAISARQWTARVEQELTRTQDALAAQAVARDATAFRTILRGRSGIVWIYDLWRVLRARWRGQRVALDHESEPTPADAAGPRVGLKPALVETHLAGAAGRSPS